MNIHSFNRNKILFWVLIILIFINLSAISTILYHSYQRNTDSPAHPGREKGGGFRDESRFLSRELGLNQDQQEEFFRLKKEYAQQAQPLAEEIQKKKRFLVENFMRADIDSASLIKQAEEIGCLQGKLKANSVMHFHRMRQSCTPEQKEKFQEIVKRILLKDVAPLAPGEGNGKGRRHRHGQHHPSLSPSDSGEPSTPIRSEIF